MKAFEGARLFTVARRRRLIFLIASGKIDAIMS
jgi:hypothetical protein